MLQMMTQIGITILVLLLHLILAHHQQTLLHRFGKVQPLKRLEEKHEYDQI